MQVPLSPAAQEFSDDLRPAGANVTTSTRLTQPIFSVGRIVLKVNGEDMRLIAYPNEASARVDAAVISQDASIINCEVMV